MPTRESNDRDEQDNPQRRNQVNAIPDRSTNAPRDVERPAPPPPPAAPPAKGTDKNV